jgi:hypothetical protein
LTVSKRLETGKYPDRTICIEVYMYKY